MSCGEQFTMSRHNLIRNRLFHPFLLMPLILHRVWLGKLLLLISSAMLRISGWFRGRLVSSNRENSSLLVCVCLWAQWRCADTGYRDGHIPPLFFIFGKRTCKSDWFSSYLNFGWKLLSCRALAKNWVISMEYQVIAVTMDYIYNRGRGQCFKISKKQFKSSISLILSRFGWLVTVPSFWRGCIIPCLFTWLSQM